MSLLSMNGVSKKYNVSRTVLRSAVEKGEISFNRVGQRGDYEFEESEVTRWLASRPASGRHKLKPPPPPELPDAAALAIENKLLKERIEGLEKMYKKSEESAEHWREFAHRGLEVSESVQKLLEYSTPRKKGLLSLLRGVG